MADSEGIKANVQKLPLGLEDAAEMSGIVRKWCGFSHQLIFTIVMVPEGAIDLGLTRNMGRARAVRRQLLGGSMTHNSLDRLTFRCMHLRF